MARIRSIKPEAFTSETLAALPVLVRWTFAGLWTYVDDDGRGRSNAGLIKAAVWPLDDDVTPAHIGAFLDQMEDAGLICRYEVDGKAYLHVVNFAEHQHPNRPAPSKLPACTRRTHGGLTASSVSPHPKPSSGPSNAAGPGSEASASPESPKSPESAGQPALTEDAVSAPGVRTTKSSTMPPTPLRNELGEVDGDGDGVPPTAGAAKPRAGANAKPGAEPNPGPVVAAFVEGATQAGLKRPAANIIARVGKQARELLAEGTYTADELIASAWTMGAGEWNDLAVQLRKDDAAANGANSRKGYQPYQNPPDQSEYDKPMYPQQEAP